MMDRYLPQPQQINPEILRSLGLTIQEVNEHSPERIRQRELARQMLEQGDKAYAQAKTHPCERIEIKFEGGLTLTFVNATLLPSHLEEEFLRSAPTYRDVNDMFVEAKAFLDGFGTAALKDRNWVVAINTFEVLTNGGILKNEAVMGVLKEETEKDKSTGIEIARAIEDRHVSYGAWGLKIKS